MNRQGTSHGKLNDPMCGPSIEFCYHCDIIPDETVVLSVLQRYSSALIGRHYSKTHFRFLVD